jgi:hypothetical protein
LANVLGFASGESIDFYSVQRFIPDVHIKKQWKDIESLASPRMIKSHRHYVPQYRRVIYIVRDGRDVYVSYYEYLRKQGRIAGSFRDFLGSTEIPYGFWYEHVQSWLEPEQALDLLLVRYEDLLADAQRELARMVAFIGLRTTSEQLAQAVEQSSFLQMRKIEKAHGRPYGTPGHQFVRRGTARQWPDYFDEASKEVLKARANPVLLELGYVDRPDW